MTTPHNPDQLTPEQYGASEGFRLLDEDEIIGGRCVVKEISMWIPGVGWCPCYRGSSPDSTYRTRLTRAAIRSARGLEPEPVAVMPDALWIEMAKGELSEMRRQIEFQETKIARLELILESIEP